MNRNNILILLTFLIGLSCITSKNNANLTPVERQIKNADWHTTELSDGVSWKYFHFDTLFSAKQHITLFDVNLNKNVRIDIPFVTEGFVKTSDMAVESDAIAAINGSFLIPPREDQSFSSERMGRSSTIQERHSLPIGRTPALSSINQVKYP